MRTYKHILIFILRMINFILILILLKILIMSVNKKITSKSIASLAAKTLSQKVKSHQTGAEMEDKASMVLKSNKYSQETKKLAGSVLAQSNKGR